MFRVSLNFRFDYYFDWYFNYIRQFLTGKTRLSASGLSISLNCYFLHLHLLINIDRNLIDDWLRDDLDSYFEELGMVNDLLIVGHVDGLVNRVRQDAFDCPVAIVDCVIGVVAVSCFVVFAGRFVEFQLVHHSHYLLGGVHHADLVVAMRGRVFIELSRLVHFFLFSI